MRALLYLALIALGIRPACVHVTTHSNGMEYEYWNEVNVVGPSLCAVAYPAGNGVWIAAVPHPTFRPHRHAETRAFMSRGLALRWVDKHCRTVEDKTQ